MRTFLSTGSKLNLSHNIGNNEYIIDGIIGEGASSIVYSAHSFDNLGSRKKWLIKECFPIGVNAQRHLTEILWLDEQKKRLAFERFKKAYLLLSELRNAELLGNNIVLNNNICEANGTLYTITEVNFGRTFNKLDKRSIDQILAITLELTRVIEKLHSYGYLHLDIKPENFLVAEDASARLWLFDADSFVSLEAAKQGELSSLSYSSGWSAPEQVQGQFTKIGPGTDVYGIGAVLFEKIVGRKPTSIDRGFYAEWELEGELFEKVNPKIKKVLTNVFHKTLSSSIVNRYQSVHQLELALLEALKISLQEQYLISCIPSLTSIFLGREEELEQIQHAFSTGAKVVFLHGVGGIGKSTVALAYGNKYEKDYDVVTFLRYRGSLHDLMNEIEIQNFEDESNKIKTLRSLVDQRVLLIIDNFDVAVDADDYFDELMTFNCKFIFTTRTDFSSVYGGEVQQIEVCNMPLNILKNLFLQRSNMTNPTQHELDVLNRLMKALQYHTYLIEILARQLVASEMSLDKLSKKVCEGLYSFENEVKVKAQKDGRVIKQTIPEIMRELFVVANLDESRKQVLRNMYMLGFVRVNKNAYWDYTGSIAKEMEALNDLIELGWIQNRDIFLELHPLVEELVKNELEPNHKNCKAFYSYIESVISNSITIEPIQDFEQQEFDVKCEFLFSFFESVGFDNKFNLKMATGWMQELFCKSGIEEPVVGELHFSKYESFYIWLSDTVERVPITGWEAFCIRHILFFAWLYEHIVWYLGSEEHKQAKAEERSRCLLDAYRKLISSIRDLPPYKVKKAKSMIRRSLKVFDANYHIYELPEGLLAKLYSEFPRAMELTAQIKIKNGIPLTEKDKKELSIAEVNSKFTAKTISDIEEETERHEIYDYNEQFSEVIDKEAFIVSITTNQALLPMQRAARIHECLNTPFFQIHFGVQTSHKIDWNLMENLLDIEVDYLLDDKWNPEPDVWMTWESFYDFNKINRVITYATNGKISASKSCAKAYFKTEETIAELQKSSNPNQWWMYTDINSLYCFNIKTILQSLRAIKRTSLILINLIQYTDDWLQYANGYPNYDEKYFFSLYNAISIIAEEAADESDVSEQDRSFFKQIEVDYGNRINRITGKTFKLKNSVL